MALPLVATANDIAPPEAYVEYSEIRNVAISPSGKFVAYRIFERNEDLIVVIDVASGEAILSTTIIESNLSSIRFVNDKFIALDFDMNRLTTIPYRSINFDPRIKSDSAATIARRQGVVSRRVVRFLDLEKSSFQRNYIGGFSGGIIGIAPGLNAIYVPWDYGSLVKYTANNGILSTSLASGTSDTLDWYMNRDHEPLIREDFDHSEHRYFIYVFEDGEKYVLLSEAVNGRDIDVVALSPLQDSLIYLTRRPGFDRMTYHTMDLQNGTRSEPIFSRHIGRVLTDSGRTAFGFERDKFPGYEYVFLSDKAESLFRSIEKRLPGLNTRLVASSDDLEHMVVRVSRSWGAAHYLFFSQGKPRPVVIGENYSAIANEQSMPRTLLEFQASDGRSIFAYLTMPTDGESENEAPLIVLVNGSRHAIENRKFQWLAQFLASRGYIVVQPGIRGVYYRAEFMPKGDLSWGNRYEDDIDETVQHLVEEGITKAERACVIGIENGGYAALSAAARSPEKYRCVASAGGLADLSKLFDFARESKRLDPQSINFIETAYGVSGTDKSAIKEKSPKNRVEPDFPPTLLMFFTKGNWMIESSAKSMRRSLKREGVSSTLVRLPGTDFRISEHEARPVMLDAIAEFIDENLPSEQ